MNYSQKCYNIIPSCSGMCIHGRFIHMLFRVVVRMVSVCGKGEQLERKEVVVSS